MARIFTTGAEESDPSALWDVIDSGQSTDGNGEFHAFGYNDFVNYSPRTGRGMYLLTSNQFLEKNFGADTSKTELYWGFSIRPSSIAVTNTFFYSINDDPGVYTSYCRLDITNAGAIALYRVTTQIAISANGIISAGNTYYIEIWHKPLDAGGRFVVKVDGVTVIDFTGDTTAEETFISAWRIYGNGSSINPMAFDDIVVNDTSTAFNNSYPGIVRLLPIRAQSAGTYQQWARAGVDLGFDAAQARWGTFEFTMMQTADVDKKETFVPELPDLPVGASITNIIISQRARVQAGAGVIAPMVISGATEDISADQNLISNWRYYQNAWPEDPADSNPWTEADLADLEIGYSS